MDRTAWILLGVGMAAAPFSNTIPGFIVFAGAIGAGWWRVTWPILKSYFRPKKDRD